MLDGQCAFKHLTDADIEIYWAAYLGMPDEITASGRIGDCADDIERRRTEARNRKGWIMDTYLLKCASQGAVPDASGRSPAKPSI